MKFKEYLNNYLNEGFSLLGSGKGVEGFDNESKPISIKALDKK